MGKVSGGRKSSRFRFIAEHRDEFGVRYLCSRLAVSPAGFYKWLNNGDSARTVENRAISQEIKRIFVDHDGNYGAPRVHAALLSQGLHVNHKRVERLMREGGMIGKAGRLYRRHALPGNPCMKVANHLREAVSATKPNQHWAGDVTYLKVKGEWQYLAVIIDLYSRKIVGWALDSGRTVELTVAALKNALSHRQPEKGMIFHSDRGAEYGAFSFQYELNRAGIRPSMNRPRHMTDNAHVESFFRTMKTESYKGKEFRSVSELRATLSWYIDHYYNAKRIHSSLGFKPPSAYEKLAA